MGFTHPFFFSSGGCLLTAQLVGKINPIPGFVDYDDVTIGVGDFVTTDTGEAQRNWYEIGEILNSGNWYDIHKDQSIRIPWEQRDDWWFLTVDQEEIVGQYITGIKDVYPLDSSIGSWDPVGSLGTPQEIFFGDVLHSTFDNRYYIFFMAERKFIDWQYARNENEWVSVEYLDSITHGWSDPATYDPEFAHRQREWSDEGPRWSTHMKTKEMYSSLGLAMGSPVNAWVMINSPYDRFPQLYRINKALFQIKDGPNPWTDSQANQRSGSFSGPEKPDDMSQEEFDKIDPLLERSPLFSQYMEVNRPPLEIMPYLKYTMADYIPSSSKKRRVVILDDPAWLSWHFATIKIFGTDEISFLEPPYLFNGKPVLFKSGENGEGPMMSGTFIELWYCDQWGTPYRDPLRKFPWKYVKLSRYLGDLLHHGTNARIIDDSGKEHLIGGRWIFPGHDKDKGERPQEKDDGISPDSWLDEKIKDAQT